jgi:hypothetical protein
VTEQPPGLVRVRRTGGFAGRAVDGAVELERVRDLVERIASTPVSGGTAWPDMYTYVITLPDGVVLTVPEHLMTDDLRMLVGLALGS